MKAWIDKPANTVAMNRASLRSSPPMSTILATRWAMRLQIPIGAYLKQNKKGKQIKNCSSLNCISMLHSP